MSMEYINRICPNCKNPNYMVLLGDFSESFKYKCTNCNRYFNDIDFKEPLQPSLMANVQRPDMAIVEKTNEDGWKTWDEIEYRCPVCKSKLKGYRKEDGCMECNVFFDWGEHEPKIVITKSIQWFGSKGESK